MSSLAQEESRSISENCTWGQRKRMADGKVSVPFGRFLGYDCGPNGELIVNEEQAQIVRRIYGLFLQGLSYYNIAKQLTAEQVLTPGGKEQWRTTTIKSILSNEKYKGDALLQKSFCTDFLTKKFKVNEGEIPQYYVENDHAAIIEPEIFDMVQREILKRRAAGKNYSGAHLFSCKIRCAECGSWYGPKVWHSNSKYRTVIWQCNHKYDSDNYCATPHLTDDQIKQAFLVAINKFLACKDEVVANAKEMTAQLFDTADMEKERAILIAETQLVSDMVKHCIHENATIALDQADYQTRYDALVQRFDAAKAKLDAVEKRIQELKSKRSEAENFIRAFERQPQQLTEFSDECWLALMDYATAHADGTLSFTLKNGMEVK